MATEFHITNLAESAKTGAAAGVPVRSLIRDGVAGNFDVIYQMIRLTRDSVKYDLGLKNLISDILDLNGLDSNSTTEDILRLVFNFVAKSDSVIIAKNAETGAITYNKRIKYILDAAGRIETIKTARQTLRDRFGDCDDHAILNASLLGCLGFEDVKFAIAKYIPSESYQHIYCVVYKDGKRYIFDTTLRDADFNKEAKSLERKEIPIFSDVVGLDGLSGIINNTRYHARKFGEVITKTIPATAGLLPLGFFAGSIFATGAEMLNQSNYKELSFNATVSRINDYLDDIIKSLCKSEISLDLAKSLAMQSSVQINAVTNIPQDAGAVKIMKESIKNRLEFIANFEDYARKNNIRIVYLNSNLMLLTGLAGIGFAGYQLYKMAKG